jgi:hypothetical protein
MAISRYELNVPTALRTVGMTDDGSTVATLDLDRF